MTRIGVIGSPGIGTLLAVVEMLAPAVIDSVDAEIDRMVRDTVAAAEAEEAQRQTDTQRLADMKAAFARAAELRDTPYMACILKSKHGGRQGARTVLRTNEKKDGLVKCLIPYNETEQRNAKDKFFVTHDNPRPHLRRGIHMPVRMHEQWVNESRLQRIA